MPDPETVESVAALDAPVVDYKAQYEALAAEKTALLEQHKGLQRQMERLRKQGADQDAVARKLDSVIDRLSDIETAVVSGDLDDTARDRIAQSKARATQTEALRQQSDEQAALIREAIDGTELDWETSPELEAARTAWSKAYETNDLKSAKEALRETLKAVKRPRAAATPVPTAQPTVEPPTATAPARPVTRVDTGGPTAPRPSAITLESFQAMSAEERMTRWPEIKKALWGV